MSILGITLAVGYSNHAAFTRAFKKKWEYLPLTIVEKDCDAGNMVYSGKMMIALR